MPKAEAINRAWRLCLLLVGLPAAAGLVLPCFFGKANRDLVLASRVDPPDDRGVQEQLADSIDITDLMEPKASSDARRVVPVKKPGMTDVLPDRQPAAKMVTRAAPKSTIRLLRVTAYCPCPICCGRSADGITSSGRRVSYHGGRFVATDLPLAFGRTIRVPGYNAGRPVSVEDRMGDPRVPSYAGQRIDVYFPTHAQAKAWGARWLKVEILTRS